MKRSPAEQMEHYEVTEFEVLAYLHRHFAVSFNQACRQMAWHKYNGETNEYSKLIRKYRRYITTGKR